MQIKQINTKTQYTEKSRKNTNFRGAGDIAVGAVNKFFQVCDDVPMIGVSFMDGASAIVPRTVVDLKEAGVPAAAETLRRESSGLVVNCLIPGAFVCGAAKLLNNGLMKDFLKQNGKAVDLSTSWANEEAIKNLVGVWVEQSGLKQDISDLGGEIQGNALNALKNKKFESKKFIKAALYKLEGLNGVDSWERFSNHEALLDRASEILSDVIEADKPKGIIQRLQYNYLKNKAIQNAYNVIVNGNYSYKNNLGKTVTDKIEDSGLLISQNLKFDGKRIGSNLKNFLRDSLDIGEVLNSSEVARKNPNKFIKKATSLVNSKSLIGLGIVLPLAMSMQYINRAITRKKYNKSGAPIYKDFESETRVLSEDEKKKLKILKPLAAGSIVGLAALSMGKALPKNLKDFAKMLQFNTKFPSLNQCRVIATATFASRMFASEDPNELRESTVRDLATFSGLYFLGDYAEKLTAELIQKFSKPAREGKLQMFNRTRAKDEYKNVFERLRGWIKDKSIKSFDEIPKEYKGYRSLAKIGGLGFSIVFLGVLLPMYNRHVTKKKEAKRKAFIENQNSSNSKDNKEQIKNQNSQTKPNFSIKEETAVNLIKDLKNKPEFSKVASKFIN